VKSTAGPGASVSAGTPANGAKRTPTSTNCPGDRRTTPARLAVDATETVELPGGGEAKVPVEEWFVNAEALCLPHLLWFEGDPRAPEREALFDGPLHHLRG
jgi:hypothetical protein